jgi:hypothetical protein
LFTNLNKPASQETVGLPRGLNATRARHFR